MLHRCPHAVNVVFELFSHRSKLSYLKLLDQLLPGIYWDTTRVSMGELYINAQQAPGDRPALKKAAD